MVNPALLPVDSPYSVAKGRTP